MSGRASPIASAMRGRIRVRHPLLRRADRMRALTGRLAAEDGLRVVETNPGVGSLLVQYDPAAMAPAVAEARVAAAARAVLEPAAPAAESDPEPLSPAAPAAVADAGQPELKWRINRAAKIGMMGSMAATLAALGVGKRLHAGAGAVFVAMMLVHMAIQRKRLFQ